MDVKQYCNDKINYTQFIFVFSARFCSFKTYKKKKILGLNTNIVIPFHISDTLKFLGRIIEKYKAETSVVIDNTLHISC